MIRSSLRNVVGLSQEPDLITYDMFSQERSDREARAAEKLERIYHLGQEKAWNGKEVLAELMEKHGGIQLAPEKLAPLRRIFAVIFWGELAAWKVSAQLALELVPLEAKMAASSQAHDEARHFYVMHDYLEQLKYTPESLSPSSARILASVLSADSLAKKLMGMQLMVEPVALTLFQLVRESQIEPVLCDLLVYYERDEARHVALGIQYLPHLIAKMSAREKVEFLLWKLKLFSYQLDALRELETDVRALGYHPREVIRLGQLKLLHAARLLEEEAPMALPIEAMLSRLVEFRMALDFPESEDTGAIERWTQAIQALALSAEQSREIAREIQGLSQEDTFPTTPVEG